MKTTPKGIIITRAELHELRILSISLETTHTMLLISCLNSVIISLFTSYVLILLFKLFIHFSFYCRWINEFYSSLFYSYTCVLCLFNKNQLNFVDGNKVVEWRDSFSHDDLRGKVLLRYVGLLSSYELRHLIYWITCYFCYIKIIWLLEAIQFLVILPVPPCTFKLLFHFMTQVSPMFVNYLS